MSYDAFSDLGGTYSARPHWTSGVLDNGVPMADLAQKTQSLDEKAARAVRAVRDQADETSQNVQAVAGTFYSALQKSLKQQPMTTFGFAIVMGFILGALWKA